MKFPCKISPDYRVISCKNLSRLTKNVVLVDCKGWSPLQMQHCVFICSSGSQRELFQKQRFIETVRRRSGSKCEGCISRSSLRRHSKNPTPPINIAVQLLQSAQSINYSTAQPSESSHEEVVKFFTTPKYAIKTLELRCIGCSRWSVSVQRSYAVLVEFSNQN